MSAYYCQYYSIIIISVWMSHTRLDTLGSALLHPGDHDGQGRDGAGPGHQEEEAGARRHGGGVDIEAETHTDAAPPPYI